MMEEEEIESLINKYLPEVARAIGSAVASGVENEQGATTTTSGEPVSGSRSGASTLDQTSPLNIRAQIGGIRGLFGNPNEQAQSLINQRVAHHQGRRSGADGFLPSYFGGQINWQQIAQSMTDAGSGLFNAQDTSSLRSRAGNVMQNIGSYAEENALAIESGIHFAQRLSARSKGLEGFGSQLGASPGDGTFSSIGPIRPPFVNPAALTGIRETLDSTVYGALNAGISGAEQRALKTQLSDVGFYSGQEDRDTMLKGLEELYKFDPAVADPELFASATRYGQTPVDDVVKSMKELKEVAKAANVGVEDFIAQVKAAGEAAKDSGGSMAKGVGRAKMFSSATGLPASTGEAIQASPVVEGMMSGMFGATPYEMGAIAPGTQTLGSMEALQQVISTVGPMEPLMINGVEVLSGEDRRAAMISEMLGGTVETSQIKKLMNKDFAHNARETLEVENAVSLAKSKKGEGKEFVKAAGNITKEVVNAKNRKGQPLYTEKEIEDVKNAGGDVKDIGFNSVTGEFNIDAITDGGMFNNRLDDDGKKLRDWLYDQGYEKESKGQSDKDFIKKTLTPNLKKTYIATQKVEAGERAEAGRRSRTEGDRTSETKATIDFTPQAKKWLQEVTPGAQNNNARDAGGRSSVQNQNGPSKFGQGV